MADTESILGSHNRLCQTVLSALVSMEDPSQLLALKCEVEGMLQLLNEVRHPIRTIRIRGIDSPWD